MNEAFTRTSMLLGTDAMDKLSKARVAVFGLGGVGGYVVEALARSGVGTLDLIDNDIVCESNLNRQIIALRSTIGMYKVDAAKARIHDINPVCVVNTHRTFFTPETAGEFDFTKYDYVVDAIDTVTGKIQLVMQAKEAGTPIICSMGAGNKLDPSGFMVADIYKTSVCPLAKVMRHELKKRGVKKLKVVYSKEIARTPITTEVESNKSSGYSPLPEVQDSGNPTTGTTSLRRLTPGSNAFVPSAAGLLIAAEVIADLTGVRASY